MAVQTETFTFSWSKMKRQTILEFIVELVAANF